MQTSDPDTAATMARAPVLAPGGAEDKSVMPTEDEAASPFAVLVRLCCSPKHTVMLASKGSVKHGLLRVSSQVTMHLLQPRTQMATCHTAC